MNIKYKKTAKIILVVIVIAVLIYINCVAFIAYSVSPVINDAIHNKPYNHSQNLDEIDYDYMNPIQPESEEGYEYVTSECSHSLPILIPFTNIVHYNYDYNVYDQFGDVIYGSLDTSVLLKIGIEDYTIRIHEVHELVTPLKLTDITDMMN